MTPSPGTAVSFVRRSLVLVALLGAMTLALAAPAGAGSGVTYTGAFEFQGIANNKDGKVCNGQGSFGEMKPKAKVTISERDSSGDFSVIAKGKLAKGKQATASDGEKVCRMTFKAKAKTAPADDSTVYLEIKGVAFDIQFPVSQVADGDLGTWTCEFTDTTCAQVVGD